MHSPSSQELQEYFPQQYLFGKLNYDTALTVENNGLKRNMIIRKSVYSTGGRGCI